MLYLAIAVCSIWIITLALPWQSWRVREVLDSTEGGDGTVDLGDVTVVIPARNEADVISTTLLALAKQGRGLKIIVIDDESIDGTAKKAEQIEISDLTILRSKPLPLGWSGKLWAQHQGLAEVDTPLTLLLDADIELQPGILATLKKKRDADKLQFVSLMAQLRLCSFWEKLLMPAFIHFFKMLYPFALVNQPGHKMAAAAGGCILVETHILKTMGGMEAIKSALIDDCALAKEVKSAGHNIWIGLTHSAISQRSYQTLTEITDMVARTAYTQLSYSLGLLLACTVIMLLLYGFPLLGLFTYQGLTLFLCVLSYAMMIIAYSPTLRFYSFSILWGVYMPIIAVLFLSMTWISAIRYWRGERSRWKGRVYQNL